MCDSSIHRSALLFPSSPVVVEVVDTGVLENTPPPLLGFGFQTNTKEARVTCWPQRLSCNVTVSQKAKKYLKVPWVTENDLHQSHLLISHVAYVRLRIAMQASPDIHSEHTGPRYIKSVYEHFVITVTYNGQAVRLLCF